MLGRILFIVYLVIGVIVANNHGYFNIDSVLDLLSAFIAVILWPLPALGINVHIGHVAKELDKKAMGL